MITSDEEIREMEKVCVWCGGNFFPGFECKMCGGENENLVEDFNPVNSLYGDAETQAEEDAYELSLLQQLERDFQWLAEEEEEPEELVVQPEHYTRWPIEPKTFVMRNGFEFWRGNIIKYSSRAGYKVYEGKTPEESEVLDLRKAIRYAEMRINLIEGEQDL